MLLLSGMLSLVLCSALAGLQHRQAAQRERRHENACIYKACHETKPGFLNVHIVSHTHNDVGWVHTVNFYYRNYVRTILDSVVAELEAKPDRRFIYVEMAFFTRWWEEQTPEKQASVRALIEEGRLEFAGGGWCMNDEATTHYTATVDEMSLGLRWLNATFGHCGRSRVAWQIDPFGHARQEAALFAQMGFDGLFLGRIHLDDKEWRQRTKQMEFLWRADKYIGEKGDIFTGVLPNVYWPPTGFCFDVWCVDETLDMITESGSFIAVQGVSGAVFCRKLSNLWFRDTLSFMKRSRYRKYVALFLALSDQCCNANFIFISCQAYNGQRRAREFLHIVGKQAKHYSTNHTVVTMGMDFHYRDASKWFRNLDSLIHHINAEQANGSRVHAFYSTPACYLKALHESGLRWPEFSDDFFPYADQDHAYWTGYYTSRPNFKYFARHANGVLQACKQLKVIGQLDDSADVDTLAKAVAVLQHHDAISGTQKQHVAEDYVYMTEIGIKQCEDVFNKAYRRMLLTGAAGTAFQSDICLTFCPLLNISSCEITETADEFFVFVYNPLSTPVQTYARLPVTGGGYEVKELPGQVIEAQLVPVQRKVLRIPERKTSTATSEIVFPMQLPPMGVTTYQLRKYEGEGVFICTPRFLCRLFFIYLCYVCPERLLPTNEDIFFCHSRKKLPRNFFFFLHYFCMCLFNRRQAVGCHAEVSWKSTRAISYLLSRALLVLIYSEIYKRKIGHPNVQSAVHNSSASSSVVAIKFRLFFFFFFFFFSGFTLRDSESSAVFDGGSEAPAIDNGKYRLFLDPVTGLLSRVMLLNTGLEVPFRQSLFAYLAYEGVVEKPSGAYSFNPSDDQPIDLGRRVNYSLVKGPLVQEIHQTFSDWVSQVIRLYKDEDIIEFDWVVGPIPFRLVQQCAVRVSLRTYVQCTMFPSLVVVCGSETCLHGFNNSSRGSKTFALMSERICPVVALVYSTPLDFHQILHHRYHIKEPEGREPSRGKEIISRYQTSIWNNGTFYTDSNGRQTIKRTRNAHRPWTKTIVEPTTYNYYPVVSWIYLKNETHDLQLTVFPDRPQGGSSLHEGELELMLHRRLQYDDSFGVEEPLNEIGVDKRGLVARGTHRVFLGSIEDSERMLRSMANRLVFSPQFAFHTRDRELLDIPVPRASGLQYPLPPNLHLLTLEPVGRSRAIVRLEHLYPGVKDNRLNKPASVSLKNMLVPYTVTAAEETVLSAHEYLRNTTRFHFETRDSVRESPTPALLQRLAGHRNAGLSTGASSSGKNSLPIDERLFTVTVNPGEIRTFLVTLEPKNIG
ncbi:lysosomal alpha-mannosidase-like [Dermacentor andersoni]|uniref:lysosomal alpha-mannosidase-like n=1 Tax=Dermacentor andersoni TaxID=34620 RepID=UPI003B3B649A